MSLNIEVIPADTTREAFLVNLEILRRLTPDRRLAMACRMTDNVRAIAAAGVRIRHPEYDGWCLRTIERRTW
jgi:hypothetical protein